ETSIVTIIVVLSSFFENFYFKIKQNELINEGQQLITLILQGADPLELLDVSKFINAHAVIVDKKGLIKVGSGFYKRDGMGMAKKQFTEVLKGNIVVHKGHMPQFNAAMLTVALPIKTEVGVAGALILYSPMASIQSSIWHIRRLILIAGASSVLIATVLSFVLSKNISKPLVEMKNIAEDMAKGNFDNTIEVTSDDEIGTLAKTMNYMSSALETNINALSNEKKQLHGILQSMTDGVITFNADGDVILVNPQALEILSLDISENEGKYFDKLLPLYDKVREDNSILHEEVNMGGRIISVRMAPLFNEKHFLWGVVAVLQDVTIERKTEHMRREFVSNVSHELRTPLSYLQGYTEALLDGMAKDSDEKQKYLNIIHEETLRLRRLVNELLDLSRIETGQIAIDKKMISINKIIERVIKKVEPAVDKRGVKIETQYEDLPMIAADEDRIQQVILNLVDNAIRYTKSNGKITIKASNSKGGIVVSIRDDGEGIPEDELPFIWDRFYKTDKSRVRDKGGTGLGLAIVKNIVELHDGKVWAKNCKKGGAEFSFFLPEKSNDME
ncbi:MAG TPA: cell wall metabolism sensor histidine kinase WalK, partial [Thermoanaerobacterales bacterium]|nr:cell wall metabolism sensor histidine kinase WalK [Thermoanaerobacterales bacterium]